MDTLRSIPPLVLLLALPVGAIASDAGVREFLRLNEQYETGGNCIARPPNGSAIGCYQMTNAALRDVGLKGKKDNWLPNPWNITSDAEFQRNRAANDYAMKQYARLNWSNYLDCDTKRRLCTTVRDVRLDPAALLTGAHFLGAGYLNHFVACGMGAECIPDRVVRWNGRDRARIHRRLLDRMRSMSGLDISELTREDRRRCGVDPTCGADPDPPPPPPPPLEYIILALITGIAVLAAAVLLAQGRVQASRPLPEDRHNGRSPADDSAGDADASTAPPPAPGPKEVMGTLQPADGSPPIPLPRALLSSRQGFVIGRDVELSDVQIPDSSVSGRHLRLRIAGGTLLVEDLNSLSGTQVDGVPLTPFDAESIAPGQTLYIAGRPYELLTVDDA